MALKRQNAFFLQSLFVSFFKTPYSVFCFYFFLLHFPFISCDTTTVADFRQSELICEYTTNPMEIETGSPRLSWQLISNQNGQQQTAYRILMATSVELLDQEKADMWDSGRQESNQSVNVSYTGKPLEPGSRYYWKVKAWDINGNAGEYSDINWFETGKMNKEDWQASWISSEKDGTALNEVKPAPYFRKEFMINSEFNKARLYISGLGYYRSYLNGNPTDNNQLQPVFTRYDKKVKYNIYDVTGLLRRGNNCIGVVLGNGWYNQHTRSAWDLDKAVWRNWPS